MTLDEAAIKILALYQSGDYISCRVGGLRAFGINTETDKSLIRRMYCAYWGQIAQFWS